MTEDQINQHIGEKILNLRIQHKFKQHDLSTLLGVTRTSIVNMEAGRQGVSTLKLWKLASLFQVPISYFFPPLITYKVEETADEIVIVKKIRGGRKFIHE